MYRSVFTLSIWPQVGTVSPDTRQPSDALKRRNVVPAGGDVFSRYRQASKAQPAGRDLEPPQKASRRVSTRQTRVSAPRLDTRANLRDEAQSDIGRK